jgi:hypothetical protein
MRSPVSHQMADSTHNSIAQAAGLAQNGRTTTRNDLNVIDNTLADCAIPLTGPFQAALEEQSKIGWLGMLRGYWANAWQQAYVDTIHVPLTEERKDQNKRLIQMAGWQKKLVQVTWSRAIKLWTTRNDERHGWEKESRDQARREVLHKELEDLYERKD